MSRTIRSRGHVALLDALVRARREAGLTQTELAQRLGVHQSYVARIEGGGRRVDAIELIVLARALGVPAVALLAEAEAATDPDHRL